MFIEHHNLHSYKDGFILTLYVDSNSSEFAKELTHQMTNNHFPTSISAYIASSFDRIKIYSVKIVIGSILFAVIPLEKDTASASTNLSHSTETYTVVSGDSLFLIANRFNVTVNELKTLNNLTSDHLSIGQTLLVPSQVETKSLTELYGKSRYDTSVVISKKGWPTQAEAIVLGRGDISIDALSASVLAKKHQSPLLLTQSHQLTANVREEIERLKPKKIYLAGGDQAISKHIESELQDKGYAVVRMSGQSRYDTSIQVAKEINHPSELIITTGNSSSPDALAVAPYAGIKQIPIVFTEKDSLPKSVSDYISERNIKKITIIGGSSAVSENIVSQLKQLGVATVDRIAGGDRYATSVQIAETFKSSFSLENAFFVSGNSFIDALPASPLAAIQEAPIVLTNKDTIPASVENWMTKQESTLRNVTILGGTSVISPVVRDQLSGKPSKAPTPAESPAAPPKTEATTQFYTVRSGDTLWSIAMKFNTTVDTVKQLNQLTRDQISIGQMLKIPGSSSGESSLVQEKTITYTSHTVRSGDNLWNLAIKFGVPMNELLQVNNLTHNSQLQIGQMLTIPNHHIPVKPVVSSKHGELLDWWSEARYVFSTGKTATITDFQTGRQFNVKHTMGGNHADSEPLTAQDAQIMREIWGGSFSWTPRAIIVEVDGRKLAAAMHSYPHGDHVIKGNNYNGHFCIHFLNSQRHSDGLVQDSMQVQVKKAAGQ